MAGPPRVIARARTAVKVAIASRIADLADATDAGALSPLVQVGVSGGADSLALLATTQWVASRMGLQTEAVIVDHGLQADSAEVAERATVEAERLGATARILRVHVDRDRAGGIENAAREARHDALDGAREERGALATLLGHTRDDQAEQVLLGLARGGGPRSIAGMPRARGPLLRPFLGTGLDESTALGRADTEEICALLGIEAWHDPMNDDPAFLRVRVRTEVMPMLREALGDQIDENLARTADLVRADADLLDEEAAQALEALRRPAHDPDGLPGANGAPLLALDVHGLARLAGPIRTRALREASREARAHAALIGPPGAEPARGSGKSLLRRQLLAVDALVVTWHGQAAVPLPGRIEVARRDGLLVWTPLGEDAREGR